MNEAVKKWSPDELKPIKRLDFVAKQLLDGVAQGIQRGIRHGFSSEFFDYKSYQPGDDATKIDWRLYSKTRKCFVKRFEAETSLECMILLDASKSMSWQWEETMTKHEYGVVLTAALATLFAEQRDLVGMMTFGDGPTRYVPPKSSKNLGRILGELEACGAGTDGERLDQAIHNLRRMHAHKGLTILVSDMELPEEHVADALSLLGRNGGEAILFHLLDHAEVALPFDDATHLVDSETGHALRVDVRTLRKDHKKTVDTFIDTIRTRCTECGILYLPIDTSMGFVDVIIGMIQARKGVI